MRKRKRNPARVRPTGRLSTLRFQVRDVGCGVERHAKLRIWKSPSLGANAAAEIGVTTQDGVVRPGAPPHKQLDPNGGPGGRWQ